MLVFEELDEGLDQVEFVLVVVLVLFERPDHCLDALLALVEQFDLVLVQNKHS
jgi:hypothetical protein